MNNNAISPWVLDEQAAIGEIENETCSECGGFMEHEPSCKKGDIL